VTQLDPLVSVGKTGLKTKGEREMEKNLSARIFRQTFFALLELEIIQGIIELLFSRSQEPTSLVVYNRA